MKKAYLIIAGLFTLIIVSCGGGGSSGGGGVTEVDTTQYYRNAATGDETVFKITTTNASNVTTIKYEKSAFSENGALAYPFAGEPGGTYLLETITRSDEEDMDPSTAYGSIYYAASGDKVEDVILGSEYTNVTAVTSDEPATVVVGQTYTATLTEKVYSLVPATLDQLLCTRTITATLQPVGIEAVTVPAGTYNALKIQTTTTVDESDDDVIITSTGYFWYGENKNLVKSDLNFTSSLEGTGTVHIVYELSSRTDGSSSLLPAGSFLSLNPNGSSAILNLMRGFASASQSLSLP